MSASVHSLATVNRQAERLLWREAYIGKLNTIMDTLENRPSMNRLGDITSAVLENKSGILGELARGLISHHHEDLLSQESFICPHCPKLLKSRGKKSCFIVATNEWDTAKLTHLELFKGYKEQSLVEKGFRFIKDPKFLVSTLYLKSPKRIEALLMVMTICLMVYAALEYRIRKELKERSQFCINQVGKPTRTPTAKWIFQCFAGIHLLSVEGIKDIVLNIKEDHPLILNLLGERYGAFYS